MFVNLAASSRHRKLVEESSLWDPCSLRGTLVNEAEGSRRKFNKRIWNQMKAECIHLENDLQGLGEGFGRCGCSYIQLRTAKTAEGETAASQPLSSPVRLWLGNSRLPFSVHFRKPSSARHVASHMHSLTFDLSYNARVSLKRRSN